MERDSNNSTELPIRPLIDTDLPPLYQLTEPQYQTIINRMSTLVGEVAQRLHQEGNSTLAQQMAEQSYDILRDYDDDVAEAVRWCTQPRHTDQSRLGYPRDIDPILPEPITDLPII